MNKSVIHESHFIDMSTEELKEHLGWLWESIKGLKEQMASDPEIERMTAALKTYKEDNFSTDIKNYTKLLKAARMVAQAKGIVWKVPNQ